MLCLILSQNGEAPTPRNSKAAPQAMWMFDMGIWKVPVPQYSQNKELVDGTTSRLPKRVLLRLPRDATVLVPCPQQLPAHFEWCAVVRGLGYLHLCLRKILSDTSSQKQQSEKHGADLFMGSKACMGLQVSKKVNLYANRFR